LCRQHYDQAEKRRGTSAQRGYDQAHREQFRLPVLERAGHKCEAIRFGERCNARATVADHHPIERRTLVRLGLNPNDPQYGRALCASCHARKTLA
jgi:5-methylcytosine-specific restriction protein A